MNFELEKGDRLVVLRPNTNPSESLEQYKIDNVTDSCVDLVHLDKKEKVDGEMVPVQKNMDKNVIQKAIEENRIALLKDPLEVLYYA